MLTHALYVKSLLTKTKQNDNNFITTRNDNIFTKSKRYFLCSKRERETAIIRHQNGKHRDVIQYLDVKTFPMGSAISFNSARGKLHAAVENFEHGKV